MLLIETGGANERQFYHFITQARSAGFLVDFFNLYQSDQVDFSGYDAFFLALDGDALYALLHNVAHPLATNLREIIAKLSLLQGKMIGFMLPGNGLPRDSHGRVYAAVQDIFSCLDDPVRRSGLIHFLSFMASSDATLRSGYETSLLGLADTSFQPNKFLRSISFFCSGSAVHALPVYEKPADSVPFALHVYDAQKKMHLVIAKRSLITGADVAENFLFNPLDVAARRNWCERLQRMVVQLYQLVLGRSPLHVVVKIPQELHLFYEPKIICAEKKEKVWCGWIDPESYIGNEERAVQNLLASGLTMLWIEWNPEWYLADRALRAEQREQFLQKINRFTKALSAQSSDQKKVPQIFIGTDLTSNFARAHVAVPAQDAYGRTYSKIPSPLDYEGFWKPELIEVMRRFFNEWKRVGNNVPIAGIFFDFEMYHAQDQVTQFLPLMDFSPIAWQLFCQKVPAASSIKIDSSPIQKFSYLFENGLVSRYFSILKNAARELGFRIKNELRASIPHLKFAAYNLHLPSSWFYEGFLAGLSSQEDPVVMATFSVEFEMHKEWLEKRGIYLKHLPVIMLSKLRCQEDFELIDKISARHDGAWFNRISRLEESRNPQEWRWDYGLEVSPLDTDFFIRELSKKLSFGIKNYTRQNFCFLPRM